MKRVTKTLQEATKEDVERWLKKISNRRCKESQRLRKQLKNLTQYYE